MGIRELRPRGSELLRQVERGESIEITDRGRPIAVLSPLPLPPGSPYRLMLVEGEIARASGESGEPPEPLARSPGHESASAVRAPMSVERLRTWILQRS